MDGECVNGKLIRIWPSVIANRWEPQTRIGVDADHQVDTPPFPAALGSMRCYTLPLSSIVVARLNYRARTVCRLSRNVHGYLLKVPAIRVKKASGPSNDEGLNSGVFVDRLADRCVDKIIVHQHVSA